ncbi:MAG: SDR family NAD(P)-dependent oxidoreductase [Thermoanaerobaculia bacterium]
MAEFAGRIAMVVGASAGIGRRAAERLLAEGARVGLLARRGDRLRALEADAGGAALALEADATDPAAVDSAFAELERSLGPCELLVCSAGLVDPRPLAATSAEQWERSIAANLHAVFHPVRRALPAMIAAGRGAIVCIASISGVVGSSKFPGLVPYATGKAAVIGFAEALAAEVAPDGIRVNALSPGSVDTEMLRAANPDAVPRITTDEVADSILFLLSDRSRPISGQNLHVYGA